MITRLLLERKSELVATWRHVSAAQDRARRHDDEREHTVGRWCVTLLLWSVSLWGTAVCPAWAELGPHQVVIVANSNSPDSLMVARHYATRRGIPLKHIAKLDLSKDDAVTWEEYERRLVLPLRRMLEAEGLQRSVRVLVTVYGVPLRVGAPILTTDERRWKRDAGDRLTQARSRLLSVQRAAQQIAGPPKAPQSSNDKSNQGLPEFDRQVAFLARIDAVTEAALKRAKALNASARSQWYGRLEEVVGQYQGTAGLTQLYQDFPRHPEAPSNGDAKHGLARQAEGLQILLGALNLPISRSRDALYRQVEEVYGVYGVYALAALELKRLTTEFADASVDSELSLLWSDGGDYGVGWRLPNRFYHTITKPGTSRREIPLLMVSRLDAPTAGQALKLVDQAMETEAQGLAGTIYLDARGLSVKDRTDTYGRYDQSLRDLKDFLDGQAPYRSVLDNTEARFQRPGAVPDVALYVGWYRLRQYEDAFTFRRGAIGYHMASAEAVSIHNSSESGWCKNALERGITATLGSVGEPYLDAFPEPLEFVSLMMTGQYSLVEAYYLTSRWVSWRMVLFGDPLYNPWKAKPAVPRSALLKIFTLAPIAPSDRTLDDPLLARDELRRLHEQARIRLDAILLEQLARPKAPQG
ncbi:MAG: conserved protein of unknown function [Nitrospira sp.]